MDGVPSAEGAEATPYGCNPREQLLSSMGNHLVSIAAVAYGSHYTLRRWIAIRSLQSTFRPEEKRNAFPAKPSRTPARRGWRRFLNIDTLKALGWFIGILGLEFGLIYGVGKFLTTLVVDCLWTAVEFWLFYSLTGTGIMVLWPFPSFVEYKPSTKSRAILSSYSTDTGEEWYPKVLAAMLSGLVLSTSAVNFPWLESFVVGCFVLMVFVPIEQPRMVVKTLLLFSNGILAATGCLTGLIVGALTLIGPPSPGAMTKPSPWLGRLMGMPMSAMPAVVPGLIIAMALRYDYSVSLQLHDSPQNASGNKVEIPAHSPRFRKPTYMAAMLGLVIALASLDLGKYLLPKQLIEGGGVDVCVMMVSVPLVSIFTFYPHWRDGTVRDWWTYEERWWWGASDDEDAVDSVPDATSAMIESDEKAIPISGP